MFQSGNLLRASADFDSSMFGENVIVWQDGQIIDYDGKITKYSNESVQINDGYYIKANCESLASGLLYFWFPPSTNK